MKKFHLILIVLFLATTSSFGQKIDSLRIDNNYIKQNFELSEDSFDDLKKIVAKAEKRSRNFDFAYSDTCQGRHTNFYTINSASADSVYWFFNDAGAVDDSASGFNTNYIFSTFGIYSIQMVVFHSLTSDTITKNIEIVRPLQVCLGGEIYIPEGDSVTLDASAEFSSYRWQDNSTQQTFTVKTTGNYEVHTTDVNGCVTNFSVSVRVQNPIVGFYDITSNSPYNCGDIVNLRAYNVASAGGYVAPGFEATLHSDENTSSENTLQFFLNQDYYWTTPLGYLYSSHVNNVTVQYANPASLWHLRYCDNANTGIIPYVIRNHADQSIRDMGWVDFDEGAVCDSLYVGHVTGIATFSGNGITNGFDGEGQFNAKLAGVGTHEIKYKWDNGRGFVDSMIQVVVVEGLEADAGQAVVSICAGESTTLGGSPSAQNGQPPYTYQWTPATGLDDDMAANPVATPTETTTYHLEIFDVDGNGCDGIDSVTVIVNSLPMVVIEPLSNPLCTNSSYQLLANITSDSNIASTIWSGDTQNLSATNIENPSFTPQASGYYDFTFTATNENGCSATVSMTIDISGVPTVIISPNPAKTCSNTPLQLTAHTTEGDALITSLLWSGDTQYLSEIDINTPVFTAIDNGEYNLSVTVEDANGCTAEDFTQVNVGNEFSPDLGLDIVECAGETHILDAGAGFDSYLWNDGSTAQTLEVTIPGTYWLEVELNGCLGRDSVAVSFYPFSGGEANIWYFGYTAGTDFNTEPPTALHDGRVNNYEGSATICDKFGNLLFYTNGVTIWNKNHVAMSNGTGLLGDNSSTQSGIIVPKPNSETIFYVFTVDSEARSGGLRYSIVDLSLDGGLGDVTLKNALINTPMSEKLTAVRHANNTDIWVVSHEWNSDVFRSYLVTAEGLNSVPVYSTSGIVHTNEYDPFYNPNSRGYMKASPKGSKIGLAIPFANMVQLFDFNNATGNVSSPITFDYTDKEFHPYGIEFSPDDSKFYVSFFELLIRQYDLSNFNIHSTEYSINVPSNYDIGAIQLAPNGKIYNSRFWQKNQPVINNPNLLGDDCSFDLVGLSQNGRRDGLGLPNYIQSYFDLPGFNYIYTCLGDVTEFSTYNIENVDSVKWIFNDGNATATENNTQHQFSAIGNYNVQLVVYHHCLIDTVSKDVVVSTIIKPDLGNDTTLCRGDILTIELSGYDNYQWNVAGYNWTTINIDTAGTYIVKVRNGSSCPSADTINVDFKQEILIDFDAENASCNGNLDGTLTANVSGGTEPFDLLWETGETTSSITNIGAGYYSLTVTDANNCSMTDSLELLDSPEIELVSANISCYGETDGEINLNLETGTEPFTFVWSNTETTQNISGLSEGKYIVTATDADGCITQDSAEIVEPNPLDLTLNGVNTTCANSSNGFIYINLHGGTFPYSFLWSNDSTNWAIGNLEPNEYSLTVTDSRGCVISDTETIISPLAINTQIATTNADCQTGTGGTIETIITGGLMPYYTSWSIGDTTQNLYNLTPDEYQLLIVDANGCSHHDTATVLLLSLSVDYDSAEVSCYGGNDAWISANVVQGEEPYEFVWSNGESSSTISNLSTGEYSVIITDAENCVSLDTINISSPDSIEIGLNITTPDCYGNTTGAITVNATGGIPPFQYSIDGGTNFLSTNDFSELSAATLNIVIQDDNNCTNSITAEITQPNLLVIDSVNVTNYDCFDSDGGVVTAWSSGGTGNLSYTLDNTIIQQNGLFENVLAGTHLLTVEDINSCVVEIDTLVILRPTALQIDSINQNEIQCNGNSGYINFYVSGGTGSLNYLLNNDNQQDNGHFTDLFSGQYWVSAIDENNCEISSDMLTISASNGLSDVLFTTTDILCYGDSTGQILAQEQSGQNVSYELNLAIQQADGQFNNLLAGTYTLKITNQFDCDTTIFIELSQPDSLMIELQATEASSSNSRDGQIDYFISGGEAGYQIDWFAFNNSPTDDILALYPDTYVAIVTDNNNCSAKDTVVVVGDDAISMLEVPNIFTPNNDGFNDLYKVKHLNLLHFEGVILSRWGRELHIWNNPDDGWDGKLRTGNDASNGVYYYIITATGTDGVGYKLNGALQLVR